MHSTITKELLTSTKGFYERLGFRDATSDGDAPAALKAEQAVGTVVAKLAVNDGLVVMRYEG